MCMEDIKIGRRKTTVQSVIQTDGTSIFAICNPDVTRVRVTVTGDGLNAVRVRPDELVNPTLSGFVMNGFFPALSLDIEEYGNLVLGRLFVDTAGVAMLVTVYETFLEWREKASD